jgi:penicillin-binding protein 2
VIVEHGGGGSAVAAPIARDLLLEVQRRDSARGAAQVSKVEPQVEPAVAIMKPGAPRKAGG